MESPINKNKPNEDEKIEKKLKSSDGNEFMRFKQDSEEENT